MKILMVLPAVFIFAGTCAAGKSVFQLGFEIIESEGKPEKAPLVAQMDNVAGRGSGGKYKYVAGGKFTLTEGYENSFEARQKDSTLLLKADYTSINKEYFRVNYDANIVFPYLESAFRFKNAVRIKPGETVITEETKLPQGGGDTRPYWVVLRVFLLEPAYAESTSGGIGAVLNVKDGYPYVLEVQSGSPAQSAGIRPGDMILQVEDVDVFARNLQDVINLIRGKPYTPVKLKISRSEQGKERLTKTVAVERWILKQ